jgi:succinate dehydrogenase / fumarate reductase cytochrome b subunit
MAVTGILLLGFLLGHMLGNMFLFQGDDAINSYAAWLQGHPLLWFLRAGLLAIFLLHIRAGIELARENRAARPTAYQSGLRFQKSGASRYMAASGLFLLVFLVLHILHFTSGTIGSDYHGVVDQAGRHDVYRMVVSSFQNPIYALVYIVAIVLLGFHLAHATQSLFQTIGINHESYNSAIRFIGRFVVVVLVVGNASIPILVLTGVIR